MIIFENPNLVKTKYPGYFWDVNEKVLYSIKYGTLKPLKRLNTAYLNRRGKWYRGTYSEGYSVSVNGNRKILSLSYLNSLKLKNEVV